MPEQGILGYIRLGRSGFALALDKKDFPKAILICDFVNFHYYNLLEDGSDLALHLQKIFEVLNTDKKDRLKTLDLQLDQFPYVNGQLFDEQLKTADFDRAMRDALIESCTLDWSKISPAIFGAMFQSVMDDQARHDIGAHYTSEENILKLIRPLFLDSLREEFNKKMDLCRGTQPSRWKSKGDTKITVDAYFE